MTSLLFLVDPVVLGALPGDDLALLEPESNLFLGVLNGIRTVAYVPSNINSEVAADCAWLRGKGVGGTEESTSGLHSITTFPNHSADGSATHILDEPWKERLGGEILIMLFKMLL